ncbi:MAG TPA: tyrosine-type recombinase/integrase [Pyrinomonadaceae bacterium]|jgi:integrase/recombinase XerD
MTLEQMFESFIREKQYLDNRSPRTVKHYRAAFKTYRRFVAGEEVTQDSINSFVVEARRAGMSAGCLNSYIRGFNSFLDWLHEQELTPTHLRCRRLKQEQKVGRAFTEDELRRLLDYKPQSFGERRAHALTLALIDTGARVDEFLSLTRENVNFESLTIKVKGKGSKERIVPMSIELRRVLVRYLKTHDHALVFPARNGAKFDYQNSYRDFTNLQKRLGIMPIGFHALRRTFAKSYLRHGGNLLYLKAVLGHVRLETTEKYVEVEGVALQETHARTSPLARLK